MNSLGSYQGSDDARTADTLCASLCQYAHAI